MHRASVHAARMMSIAVCTVGTRQVAMRRIAVAAILIVCNCRNQSVLSVSRCVTGEDEVAIFDGVVAREALFHIRLGPGFTFLIELSVTPAARRGVLL